MHMQHDVAGTACGIDRTLGRMGQAARSSEAGQTRARFPRPYMVDSIGSPAGERRSSLLHSAALIAVILVMLLTANPAVGESPVIGGDEGFRDRLGELDRYLSAHQYSAEWKKYLRWETLRALPTAEQIDTQQVDEILARLAWPAPGTDAAALTAVRRELEAFVARRLSSDPARLAEMLRARKSTYRSSTPEELASLQKTLAKDLAALEAKLAASPHGKVWHERLAIEDLHAALAEQPLNPAYLRSIYVLFSDGTPGLEWAPFTQVRASIDRLCGLLETIAAEDGRAQFDANLETLAALVGEDETARTAESRQRLADAISWLARSEQAPSLVLALQERYERPNFQIQLSQHFLEQGINRPIDEVGPVRDLILGTTIRGTGRTIGAIDFSMLPAEDRLVARLDMSAVNHSRALGFNGPATVHSTGYAELAASKVLYFDGDRLQTAPAEAVATARSKLHRIDVKVPFFLKKLVQKIAWKKAYEQKGLAERIASRHATTRLQTEFDKQFSEKVVEFNHRYESNVRQPLVRLDANLADLLMHSSTAAWTISARYAGVEQIAAPLPPPDYVDPSAVLVHVHESMVNNLATHFSGRTIDEQQLKRDIERILQRKLPEEEDADEVEGPGAIIFADARPITVDFGEEHVAVVLRTQGFVHDGEERDEPFDITVHYNVEVTDTGLHMVRDGEIQILPPDFKPGVDRMPLGKTVLVNLLRKMLGQFFPETIQPKGVELPGDFQKVGKLVVKDIRHQQGWLTVSMKVAK